MHWPTLRIGDRLRLCVRRGRGSLAQRCRLPAAHCWFAAIACLAIAGCVAGPGKLTADPLAISERTDGNVDATPIAKAERNADEGKAIGKLEANGQQQAKPKPKPKPKPTEKEIAAAAKTYASAMIQAAQLEKTGKRAEARPIYEGLIRDQPDRYEAYYRLAVIADGQRRYTEAQSLYTEALRLNSRNPDVLNDLGYCFFLQGKLNKAEAALLKAVAMRPSEPRYRNNLGLVYGHQGRHKEALEQFRRAGSEGDAYFNLAFIKASQSDMAGAKECFRHALAVDPSHDRARSALASFERAEAEGTNPGLDAMMADDDTTWIPYVEGSASQSDTAPADSSAAPAGSDRRGDRVAGAVHSATQGMIDHAQMSAAKMR